MEEAFKSLEGVAALRRQDAVGARRDRARESNARAEEGHGRACKRARMQAESKAARVEARAREAQEMAAAATSAAALLERERERKRDKAEAARATPSGREKEKKKERTRVGERKGRERMSPSPLFQPAASGDAEKNGTALVPPPKLGGGKEWKEAVASVAGGGKDGRGKETGRGESARRGRLHANEVGGRREVWVPSPAREVSPQSRRQRRVGDGGGEREAEQMAGWAEREEDSEEEDEKGTRKETEDDRAMWQRIKHLDRVAARLEGAEAGIEAKLDLIAKGGWSGRVARSSRRDSRPVYAEANAWEWGGGDGNRAKSAGAREEEIRWKRDDAVAYSPRRRPLRVARERRKPKSSPSVGRLTAPTVSSKNKSKPGASGGMAGAEGRCSKSPTKWRRASPGGKGRRVEYFEEAVGGRGRGRVTERPSGSAAVGEAVRGRGRRVERRSSSAGGKGRMTRVRRGAMARAKGRVAAVTHRGRSNVWDGERQGHDEHIHEHGKYRGGFGVGERMGSHAGGRVDYDVGGHVGDRHIGGHYGNKHVGGRNRGGQSEEDDGERSYGHGYERGNELGSREERGFLLREAEGQRWREPRPVSPKLGRGTGGYPGGGSGGGGGGGGGGSGGVGVDRGVSGEEEKGEGARDERKETEREEEKREQEDALSYSYRYGGSTLS